MSLIQRYKDDSTLGERNIQGDLGFGKGARGLLGTPR